MELNYYSGRIGQGNVDSCFGIVNQWNEQEQSLVRELWEGFIRREMLVARSLSGDGMNVVNLNLSLLYMGQHSGMKVKDMLALIVLRDLMR